MTIKGGTTPACAVCKYQRRKCSPNCPLSAYFPANQPKKFQNVHRLYGVSNITKILESLDTPDQKEDAMRSISYEAEMRHRFPVHGCSAIMYQLRLQIDRALDELRCVYSQIAACKQQQQLGFGPGFQIQPLETENEASVMYPSRFLNDNAGPFSADEMAMMAHNNINNLAAMNAFGHVIQPEERNDHYFQDFEGLDESSPSESSVKETTAEIISESELKTAAAGFSLTTNRLSHF